MKTGQKHRYLLAAAVLLASCAPRPHEEPTVVLDRAAAKARQLQSASFEGNFSYRTAQPEISVSGTMRGDMADGGRQLSFNLTGDMTMPADGPDQTVSVDADVIVADENETYLRIDRMEGSVLMLPGIGLIPSDMQHKWFSMISATGATAVTPDPSFLELQTQTLAVERDRSFQKVGGHECFAYDVTLDPEKFLAFLERTAQERGQPFKRDEARAFVDSIDAHGTIWIDAETSVIRSVSWQLKNTPGHADMSASFTATFDGHDEPVEIAPPADAVPFTDAMSSVQLPLF